MALVLVVNIIFFKFEPWTELANTIVDSMPGGSTAVTVIWGVVIVLHALEALWALYLCRKHRAGIVLGVSLSLPWFSIEEA